MSDDFEPFDNAEQVWFWFCGCMAVRNGSLRGREDYKKVRRNVEIADIYRIIKKMKFHHEITNRELRIMTKWGSLNIPPYYDKYAKRSEIRLWEQGIKHLEKHLKDKRII